MSAFQSKVPHEFYAEEKVKLWKSQLEMHHIVISVSQVSFSYFGQRFMCKHCDLDLESVVEQTVPPIDLTRAAVFRTLLQKHAKKARAFHGLLLSQGPRQSATAWLRSKMTKWTQMKRYVMFVSVLCLFSLYLSLSVRKLPSLHSHKEFTFLSLRAVLSQMYIGMKHALLAGTRALHYDTLS